MDNATIMSIPLRDGGSMPAVGLGTGWANRSSIAAEEAVLTWIRLGGRLIDSAEHYGTHEPIARAMRRASVPRWGITDSR